MLEMSDALKCVWQYSVTTANGNRAMTGRLYLQRQHEGHPREGCNGQMFYGQTLLHQYLCTTNTFPS